MSKSKIIKDLVNDSVSLETSLTRLKIILNDLNKPDLLNWVDNELTGNFGDTSLIPDYRKRKALLYAMFSGVGNGYYVTNKKIPLNRVSEQILNSSLNYLENIKLNNNDLLIDINPKFIERSVIDGSEEGQISRVVWDLGAATSVAQDILPKIKQRALDILLLLEKEFGNLDEYDIDLSVKTSEQISDIASKIVKIIEGKKPMNVQINNYGGIAQNNIADGNATITATQNNGVDIETLKRLISEVRSSFQQNVSDDKMKEVNDNLDVIEDEMTSATPDKEKILKAWSFLNGLISFSASLVTLGQFLAPYVPAIQSLIASCSG
jgi:hypothetical protein